MGYPSKRDIALATLDIILENITSDDVTAIEAGGLAHAGLQYAIEIVSASEKAEESPSPSNNTGSPKPAPEIVDDDVICDYCRNDGSDKCKECWSDGHYPFFVGRRLRAGA